MKWRLQKHACRLLEDYRQLQKCHRTPRATPTVWRSPGRSTASYRGLCTCYSVWACPVCSAKISAFRASQLTDAIRLHLDHAGDVVLATFTASHTRDDELADLITGHDDAHKRYWRQGTIRRRLDELGYLGRVTSTEVTYGHATGYHPHRHALLFFSSPVDLHHLRSFMVDPWVLSCQRSSLHASQLHGLDIRGGEQAGAYVSKLGLEVALAVCKKGRGERYGPWQLLHESMTGNTWASLPFTTFARTMRGKQHLVWSPGLRHRLFIEDRTDEDIMASGGDLDEAHYATFTLSLWRAVCKNEIRGELLRSLGVDDRQAAAALLLELGLDPADLTYAYEQR